MVRDSRRLGVRAKLAINMGILEESWMARLARERRTGPEGDTQQPKVSVAGSSGIAPGSGTAVTAWSI